LAIFLVGAAATQLAPALPTAFSINQTFGFIHIHFHAFTLHSIIPLISTD